MSTAPASTQPKTIGDVPQAPDAEKGLLSCLMQDPDVVTLVADSVDASWFFGEPHALVFSAILSRFQAGEKEPGDLIQLGQHMGNAKTLAKIGGPAYLAELHTFAPAARQWTYFRDVLRATRARRQLLIAANDLALQARDASGDVEELLTKSEAAIQTVTDAFHDTEQEAVNAKHPLQKDLHAVIEAIEARFEQQSRGVLAGLATGLTDFDKATDGLQPGRVYLIGARPKKGKSSLVRQILLSASKQVPVLLHSLEMSREQTVEAMLVTEGRLNASDIGSGRLNEKIDFPALTQAASRLADRPIFVQNRAVTVHQIVASARRHQRLYKIGLLAVDYIQRIRPHDPRQDARANIGYASHLLADLAIQLKIPIILLAQLNRDAEGLSADRLHMGHLKECGDLEQDASFIGLLGDLNDEAPDPDSEMRRLGLHIVAQRFGAGGLGRVLPLAFFGHRLRFETLAYQETASCP